jgi:hypothetical protein
MTALPSTSVRAMAARRFGDELAIAMCHRKVGRRRLAQILGMGSDSTIAAWRAGDGLPRLATAVRVADCLAWPSLARIIREARTAECDVCARVFVNESGGPKRYCSVRCRKVKAKSRSGATTRYRADVAERRLAEHRTAVETMCGACSPEGICDGPDCPLRGVSPLPLRIDRRDDPDTATPADGPYGTPQARARTRALLSASTRGAWRRPGERDRRAEVIRASLARRRDRASDEPGVLSAEPGRTAG